MRDNGHIHTGPSDDAMPRSEYLEHRAGLKSVLRIATGISANAGGQISESGRQYWSSVLFTKLVVSTITLFNICPYPKNKAHWDLSSVACIVRSNFELWLFFVWLCVETTDDEVWYFRTRVFWLMDNRARFKLIEDGGGDTDATAFMARQGEIRLELEKNRIFLELSDKKKQEIMRGDKLPYIQDDILDRLGVNRSAFRFHYRYLNSFVHTGPISFFRMAEHRRGNGEENPYDRAYIGYGVALATQILAACAYEMMALHPEAAISTIERLGDKTIETLVKHREAMLLGA